MIVVSREYSYPQIKVNLMMYGHSASVFIEYGKPNTHFVFLSPKIKRRLRLRELELVKELLSVFNKVEIAFKLDGEIVVFKGGSSEEASSFEAILLNFSEGLDAPLEYTRKVIYDTLTKMLV